MATYNGASYIENQLLSLIGQSHKTWRLLIHDDGSTDNSISIIKKIAAIDDRVILIEDEVVCGGSAKNFLHLLSYVKSDFVAFCDQDDIWFEKKLEILFNTIKSAEIPTAVYCNAYGYDGTKIITDKVTLFHRKNLNDSLFLNGGVQGCCMVLNRRLLDFTKDLPDYIYMHDHYFTIAAIVFGKLQYIDNALMFYRQHSNNVTGNIPINFWQRIRTFVFSTQTVIEKRHYEANVSFYLKFKHLMSDKQKQLFESYISFPDKNWFGKIIAIFANNFKIGNSIIPLLIKSTLRKSL